MIAFVCCQASVFYLRQLDIHVAISHQLSYKGPLLCITEILHWGKLDNILWEFPFDERLLDKMYFMYNFEFGRHVVMWLV